VRSHATHGEPDHLLQVAGWLAETLAQPGGWSGWRRGGRGQISGAMGTYAKHPILRWKALRLQRLCLVPDTVQHPRWIGRDRQMPDYVRPWLGWHLPGVVILT